MKTQKEEFNEWLLIENFINPEQNIKSWINEDNFINNKKDDWNELMFLVEKIENLGYNFHIISKEATVLQNHGAIYQTLIYRIDGTTKIQAVYSTVIEFIKWYNQLKK